MPSTVVVPVVFHVLYNTPSENISEAQLRQLDILNEDFRRLNEDQDDIGLRRRIRKLSFVSLFEIPTETPRRALSAWRRESPCLDLTTP